MEFQVVASSSAGNCYVVRSGSLPPLLLDAGVKFPDIQKALKFEVTSLAGSLITHAHGDHSKSVKQLLAAGVDCYMSPQCKADLGLENFRVVTIDPREQWVIEKWRVMAFEAVHDCPGTYGFLIDDCQGHRLLYLTDSSYSLYRFDGLTHIAIECNFSREIIKSRTADGSISSGRFERTTATHMSLETLVETLKKNDLSQVEEIHLLHLSDENSDADHFADTIRKTFGIPTYIASKTGATS